MRFLLVFFCILFNFGFSQSNEKVVDSLFREDQMYCSIAYNFLQNKPDNFSQYSFSAGFTAGLLRDFPISKNRHWSIAPGIGYSYSDLKQNMEFTSVTATTLPAIVQSKITLHYIELPVELRWRNAAPDSHKFWRIHSGFKLSYLVGGTLSYDSALIEKGNFKIKEVANPLQYGVYVAFGYNTWNPYIYYGLNPIFDHNKTTIKNTVSAFNIGLKFYIL